MMSVALPKSKYITFEEFVEWSLGRRERAEWVDGEIEVMMSVSRLHQFVVEFLFRLIADYVYEHDLGEVHTTEFLVKLSNVAREPDVLFVATENLSRFTDSFLNGACDLAVEVVSDDSGPRDRVTKFAEYEAAGVCEYWIIDPKKREARFYVLGSDGFEESVLDAHGRFRSIVVPGLWIDPVWLWTDPLPKMSRIWELWREN